MFLGSYNYSMDAKNRVSIPAKFRRYLKPEALDTFVMTRGLSECVYLYPMDIWNDQIAPRLGLLDEFDPNESSFLRLYLELASDDSLDTQSRIIIPKTLIEFAGIEKEVFILGAMNRIEIWNPETYKKYKESIQRPYSEIASEVMKKTKND
ncbi:MAG: division/cell wall cluster transcriptional repressor MraZ [bacterium]